MRGAVVLSALVAALAGAGVWAYLTREPVKPTRPAHSAGDVVGPLAEIAPLVEAANRAGPDERPAAIEKARARILEAEVNLGNEPDIQFWHGIVEVLAHREAESRAAYARLVGTAPGGPRNRNALYLRAIQVLEFDPDHASEAVESLREVRALAPRFMPEPVQLALFRALVRVHFTQIDRKEADKAVATIDEALVVAGDRRDLVLTARRARAYALGLASRWFECERAWRALIEDDPGAETQSRFQLASVLAMQNKLTEAEAEYSAVLARLEQGKERPEIVPALREALLRRGNCRRILEKYPEARADIEAYLTFAPHDYRAEESLALLLIDGFKKPDEALPHAIKAHEAAPYCDAYLYLLVRIYEELLPDPAKAKPLREAYETQKKERAETRAALVRRGVLDGVVCD